MKKGFTLVELLVTILILGVIALIATPVFFNVVGDAKKSSELSNAKMYVKSINETLMKNRANGSIPNGLYTIKSNGELCLDEECIKINVSGELPNNGTIEILNGEAICGYNMQYDSSIITCDDNNNLVTYEEGKCYILYPKAFGSTCKLSDDIGDAGLSIGDKVTCGTESFYVINPSGADNKVYMLAEWNLNVKEDGLLSSLDLNSSNIDLIDSSVQNSINSDIPYSYTYCKSKAGYQDSHVIASLFYGELENKEKFMEFPYYQNLYVGYGMLLFDKKTQGNGYWTDENGDLDTTKYTACSNEDYRDKNDSNYPSYVYDNNSTLKPFVDSYVKMLNNSIKGANATGRLISYEELRGLDCDQFFYECTTYPWVKQTYYWTGSASGAKSLWASSFTINVNGNNLSSLNPDYNSLFIGVRPVIEIDSSVIKM